MKRYRLYVGKLQEIPSDIEFVCYHYPQYVLLFTNKTLEKEKFARVPDDYLDNLTEDERVWLSNAKITVNTREMRERADEYTTVLNTFLDELEKAFKEQAEKMKKDEDDEQRKEENGSDDATE